MSDLESALRRARPVPPPAAPSVIEQARLLASEQRTRRVPEVGGNRLPRLSRRLALGVAACLIGLAGATVGAASRDWWFFHDIPLRPVSQVVVVASSSNELTTPWGPPWPRSGGEMIGDSNGVPWELVSFVAKPPQEDSELCWGVTTDLSGSGRGGAINCSATEYPGPGHSDDSHVETHWLGFFTHVPGLLDQAEEKLIAGPTNENVADVDLIVSDGAPIRVHTLAAPPGLPVSVRFYVAALPVDKVVRALVPRDAQGNALERWNLPVGQ